MLYSMLKICLRLVRIRASIFKTPMESFEPKDSTGNIRHTKDTRRLLLEGQIKGKTKTKETKPCTNSKLKVIK